MDLLNEILAVKGATRALLVDEQTLQEVTTSCCTMVTILLETVVRSTVVRNRNKGEAEREREHNRRFLRQITETGV
jgi:hypothetical protein